MEPVIRLTVCEDGRRVFSKNDPGWQIPDGPGIFESIWMHPGIGKESTDGKHSPDEQNGDANYILP